MRRPKRWPDTTPDLGANGQAVIDRLLAAVTVLEACEHDLDGFALWISTRPGHLLCGSCYQPPRYWPTTSGAQHAGSRLETPVATRS